MVFSLQISLKTFKLHDINNKELSWWKEFLKTINKNKNIFWSIMLLKIDFSIFPMEISITKSSKEIIETYAA